MATRSTIGLLKEDGTVQNIYSHWDGYPEYVGRVLMEDYTDPVKVQKLVDLGDISSLHEEVEIPENVEHSFESPRDNIVVAYHRDRGEDWDTVKPRIDKSKESYLDYNNKSWEEYRYLGEMVDGKIKWSVASIHSKAKGLIELTEENFEAKLFESF